MVLNTSGYVRCHEREIHYVEWGRANAPPLVMVHALGRTSRDFDDIAQALSDDYRIVCFDMIGRGYSQWSPDPDQEYCLDFYAQIAQALADQLSIEQMRWLGTSMGAAIGIRAGATTLKGRISQMVINDASPNISPKGDAVGRIMDYIGNPPAFDCVTEFETYLRTVYKPYGWLSDGQWRRMAETSARRLPNGKITNHYDPAIARQFTCYPNDYIQWDAYDTLSMPTLLLRGIDSDLVSAETARAMTQRGPCAQWIEMADCGHAPALNVPEQIDPVREFFLHGSLR